MTGVIDYGMGNVGSIINMIERLGSIASAVSTPEDIQKADKLILPGVGSFDNGISRLKENNLVESLNYKVLVKKTPVLCICLGMQLITLKSEEGVSSGLGWIDGECLRFGFTDETIKIPHMGWNSVKFKKESLILSEIPENPRFYFVHSFYVKCNQDSDILATTNYNFDFVSAIQKDNIYATQFHPEKSHKYGMGLIKGFVDLC